MIDVMIDIRGHYFKYTVVLLCVYIYNTLLFESFPWFRINDAHPYIS